MKVAVLQMQVALGQPAENIASLRRLAEKAMKDKPDVLLLPELWHIGFYPRPVTDFADKNGEESRKLLAELAQKYQVNIVGGTVASLRDDQVFNTCYVLDRQGQLVTSYDKAHLFSPSREHEDFTPGDSLVTFTLEGVKCGILICYDVRFPEAARKLALEGIQVLFIPSAWPLKRLMHWQTLIRARAIENQLFTAACNAAGTDGSNQQLAGHSALIDPWGEIIAEAGEGEEILLGELQLSIQQSIKESINVFADRRPELYKKSSR